MGNSSCCSNSKDDKRDDEPAVHHAALRPEAEDCVEVPFVEKVPPTEAAATQSLKTPSLKAHGTQQVEPSPAPPKAEQREFPSRPRNSIVSDELWVKAEALFHKIDADGSNNVTREEAQDFFKGAFKKMSADAMFNEVDNNNSGFISAEEFMNFWKGVRQAGYNDQDIQEELDELLEGNTWVDWKDGRNVDTKHAKFPARPWLCRLSKKAWLKAEELFKKMDGNGNMVVTKQEAEKLFSNGFSKISVKAMFNELDVDRNGDITAKEFMKFWVQVKTHGYNEALIIEEIDNILQGGAWVDWKDGRNT